MIKYKIKRKIVNCEKIETVTTHDLYPLPLSQTVTLSQTPPPWSVTYFMDGPQREAAAIDHLYDPVTAFMVGYFGAHIHDQSRGQSYKFRSASRQRLSLMVQCSASESNPRVTERKQKSHH